MLCNEYCAKFLWPFRTRFCQSLCISISRSWKNVPSLNIYKRILKHFIIKGFGDLTSYVHSSVFIYTKRWHVQERVVTTEFNVCSNVETNLSWTCLVSGLLNFEHPSVLLFCFLLFIYLRATYILAFLCRIPFNPYFTELYISLFIWLKHPPPFADSSNPRFY